MGEFYMDDELDNQLALTVTTIAAGALANEQILQDTFNPIRAPRRYYFTASGCEQQLDNQLEKPKYPRTKIALQLLYALNAHRGVLSSILVTEVPKCAPRRWTNPRRWPTGVKWLAACAVFVLGCWVAGELLN